MPRNELKNKIDTLHKIASTKPKVNKNSKEAINRDSLIYELSSVANKLRELNGVDKETKEIKEMWKKLLVGLNSLL